MTVLKFTYKVYKLHGLSETADYGFTKNNDIRALVGRNGTGENYLNKNTLTTLILPDKEDAYLNGYLLCRNVIVIKA